MVRHSKNNMVSAGLEYTTLADRWGTKKLKLGAESFRQFDQCSLCLSRAEAPVVCHRGHLYCKECIYTALLDQKKEIASIKSSLVKLERDFDAQRERARAEAIERVQKDFESVQAGVSRDRRRSPEHASRRGRSQSPVRGEGGSLADLPERIKAQTERAIQHAMEQLGTEQLQAKRSKIPAYWLPSLTPAAEANVEEDVRRAEETLEKGMETKCYIGDALGHAISIKSLVDVRFVTSSSSADEEDKSYICPSCKKGLNSVGKLYALRGCGHVHCAECIDILILPALKRAESDKAERPHCLECAKDIKSRTKDVLLLDREGTGFASAGPMETKKRAITFSK